MVLESVLSGGPIQNYDYQLKAKTLDSARLEPIEWTQCCLASSERRAQRQLRVRVRVPFE